MGMVKQVTNVQQDFREESYQNEDTDNVQVHKKISFHSKVEDKGRKTQVLKGYQGIKTNTIDCQVT